MFLPIALRSAQFSANVPHTRFFNSLFNGLLSRCRHCIPAGRGPRNASNTRRCTLNVLRILLPEVKVTTAASGFPLPPLPRQTCGFITRGGNPAKRNHTTLSHTSYPYQPKTRFHLFPA